MKQDKTKSTMKWPATFRVRASFYIKAIPQTADINAALASAFGVIRNVSVPLGITTPGQPNISSTQWRAVSDQKNKVYYFESPRSPFLIWMPLAEIDFTPNASTQKISLTEGSVLMVDGKPFAGNAARQGKPAKPFEFLRAGTEQGSFLRKKDEKIYKNTIKYPN